MPKIDYRNQAKDYLKQARAKLAAGDDQVLRYVALDLRFAMEAVTYDRAQSYPDELPPSEYRTWQPKKLMQVLLEIDPTADKDVSLAVGVEEEAGVQAKDMISLGSETVFNLSQIKKHYDAMGSYLHAPTLKQMSESPPSPDKLRKRCVEATDYLEKVLASPIWNVTLGIHTAMECADCGKMIRKRIPHAQTKFPAECFECKATYTIADIGDGNHQWKLDEVEAPCQCGNPTLLLRRDLKEGSHWTCKSCNGKNSLQLAVTQQASGDPS
ncbi:hypothetical protein GUK30_32810 [Rhizobium leguminosarum]|uniref:hypothetical protein n=1 Tax=Rhizobium ruizarguesonis TaxID=2081791 RepID=UPI0013C27946|nr:hypothetical protein [Rhizobium ruizarguesonis]NEI24129.1 hypothetical protein [Rhizobium ruizarguesonis]